MNSLHLRHLRLRNFLSHRDTALDLPERGIVLVTGPSGAGKSALVSGVSVALWGEEPFERFPWHEEGGSVVVATDSLTATRSIGPSTAQRTGKVKLQWSEHGKPDPIFESTAKADAELRVRIGAHPLWMRTHVFTRKTANAFAGGTNTDRVHLLEALLGLEVFDPALAACKRDRQDAERILAGLDRDHAGLSRQVSDLVTRVRATDAALPSPVPPDVLAAAERALTEASARERPALDAPGPLSARVMGLAAEVTRLRRRLAASPTACPSCGRPFANVDEGAAHIAAEIEAQLAEQTSVEASLQAAYAAASEAGARLKPLRERAEALRAQHAAHFAAERLLALAAGERQRVQTLETELATLAAALKVKDRETRMLVAAEGVLGVKGVRGHVLSTALPLINVSATEWLARFGRPWTVRLSSTATRKNGAVVDELSIEVIGPKDGLRGLSEGERARVHLALLCALGDLSAAAQNRSPGTLFFDEGLDPPLDAEGAADIGAALHDLADEGRCVLVIAHTPDVAATLRPDVRYRIEKGVLTRA